MDLWLVHGSHFIVFISNKSHLFIISTKKKYVVSSNWTVSLPFDLLPLDAYYWLALVWQLLTHSSLPARPPQEPSDLSQSIKIRLLRAEKPPPVKHPRLLNNTGNKALRSILFF
jgi:hypothetical protein